ncbi:hypothetical protein A4H97_06185 [Niastella yeongjuensis]|uniref:Uncharacterized protein n=1 Tax=Niastella yeongjuensis TaxID=354355 RepID=A0A1V9ELT2_9BACT|nr:hypothetical protein [Niastella yeongjuensis]OQP47097.1 hypothetical protein A4H97_06185 [Niastella yeongjuensis]SEN69800.1 hypothetical protein SAMN05660816_01265 [Niastella yeongjuensis]
MKYAFLKQLLLALLIWLFAIIINTVLGTLYLLAIKFHNDAGDLVIFGTIYGAVFSFPVMLAILIIINRYAAGFKKGAFLFNAVFISSIVLTVIVFLLFWNMIGIRGMIMALVLQCIAIVSGITSLMTFYKQLVQWGGDFNTVQKV